MKKFVLVSALILAAVPTFAQDIPKCDPPKTCPKEMHPGHWTCEPCEAEKARVSGGIHGNQFFSIVSTKDVTQAVAPGHWMIDTKIQLTPPNKKTYPQVEGQVDLVLTPDQATLPAVGMVYPGIVGDGFSNYQHPHEIVSRAEAGVEVKLSDKKSVSVSGGPVISAHTAPMFAMDPSSMANIFPRQNHHYADCQHAAPGGVQVRYKDGRNMFSGAYITGRDPNPRTKKIETYRPDSFTIGAERSLTQSGSVKIGGIAGRMLHQGEHVAPVTEEPGHHPEEAAVAGEEAPESEVQLLATFYGTTQHALADGILNTTTIFTRTRDIAEDKNSDGFSTEAAFRRGKSAFGGRFEVVDRDCLELGIHCTGQHKLKQVTGFAERRFLEGRGTKVFLNGSAVYAKLPDGTRPLTVQGGVRMEFGKSFSTGKAQ